MQAEMVHIKDELDKTGHELTELRKAKVEHIKIIEDLKVGYSIVTEYSQKQVSFNKVCLLCLNFNLTPDKVVGHQFAFIVNNYLKALQVYGKFHISAKNKLYFCTFRKNYLK